MSPATAKDAKEPPLQSKGDKPSVEQEPEQEPVSEDAAKAKVGNENDEENSDIVPEQQSSSKNANKPTLNQSRTISSSSTSQNAASSGIPGAFRVAPSFGTSSNNENNEDSDDNSPDTRTITTTEITDADVEAPVASPVKENQVTTAYLVQDELAEVEPIKPFYQRKEGRRTIFLVVFLLVILAVLLGVFLTQANKWNKSELENSLAPTISPTQAPTFDPRPTLEVVQDRGVVNCGIEDVTEGDERFVQYNTDFCRGLAAVLFGDPERFNTVKVFGDDRYVKLLGREVDVLFAGDTFTLEKVIREVRTNMYGHVFRFCVSFANII